MMELRTLRCTTVAIALASCGDARTGTSLDELRAKRGASLCELDVTCHAFPDVSTCEGATLIEDAWFTTMVDDVAARRVSYDPDLGASCLGFLATADCTFAGFQAHADNPCWAMFTGLVPAAGACFYSQECAAGTTCHAASASCDPARACCPGTCVARASIGMACSSTSGCVEGTYCAQSTATCAALAATPGATCDGLDGCADPMICSLDASTGRFTICVLPAARGATCDPSTLLPCADAAGDYCDSTTRTCTPRATTGQPCTFTMTGSTCVQFDRCINGTCVDEARQGESCTLDPSGTSNCLGDLTCTSGVCVLPTVSACM